MHDAEGFCQLLDGLVVLRGRDSVTAWQAMARAGQWQTVFCELMQQHYDPLYERSFRSSYRQLPQATLVQLPDAEAATFEATARRLVA
jgi:tRNA 2-selenouridine synthase